MNVFYKDRIVGTRRVDFLVEDVVSVEIKGSNKVGRCSPGTGDKLSGSI